MPQENGLGRASGPFVSASVILPVINEVQSLAATISTIEATAASGVGEYLLVVCPRTIPESRAACEAWRAKDPARFRLLEQRRPFLGGAMRDAFEAARSSHVLMMASDLETDPGAVAPMIARARQAPDAIVTCSRWIGGGGFSGYDPVKLVLNRIFQISFSVLYRTRLTDMTYGFRLFPTSLVNAIRWEGTRHTFLFETILKPLRLGVRVFEVPSPWKARTEGTSQNTLGATFAYVATGLRVRFARRSRLLATT